MKILYLSDTQFRATTPASRTDDFLATSLAKVDEVCRIAKEEQVDAIVHGGDFFDAPDTPYRVVSAVVNHWRMAYGHTNGDVIRPPTFAAVGNHDVYSYRVDTVDQSAIGILKLVGEKQGGFEVMDESPGTTLRVIGVSAGRRILLAATPYLYGVYNMLEALTFRRRVEYPPYSVVASDDDVVLHVTHGTIVTEPIPFPHVLIDDLAKVTEANVVLCGHWHKPWSTPGLYSTRPSTGPVFVNPGSLMRMSRAERHMPGVAILTVDEKGISMEVRILKCAEPADEVFRAGPEEAPLGMEDGEVRALLDNIRMQAARLVSVERSPADLVRAAAVATGATDKVLARALALVGAEGR